MTTQIVKSSELARARAKLYQLLAAVYMKPPDADFLKLLGGWVSSSVGTEGASHLLSEPMRQSLTMLDSFFKEKRESSWEELEEAISAEFTKLFRGVKRSYSPLPPYESLYRDESRRVFDDTTVDVLREYRRYGLELTNSLRGEPPDHISFELEFMHLLCRQEAEAWDNDDDDEALRLLQAESEFMTEHLMTWLPKFCGEVRKHDRLGLFRCLADLTEGWLSFDYRQHLQAIDPPSSTARITEGYPEMESN